MGQQTLLEVGQAVYDKTNPHSPKYIVEGIHIHTTYEIKQVGHKKPCPNYVSRNVLQTLEEKKAKLQAELELLEKEE